MLAKEKEKSLQESKEAEDKTKDEEAARLKAESDIKKILAKSDKDTNYDDLTSKEILDIVADAFDTAIDAKTKLATAEIAKPLEDINNKIESMRKYLLSREAASGVDKARGKFSDFGKYQDEMTEVFKQYPGIEVEDAYLLAKSKKAAGSPAQEDVETEKPVNLGTRAAEAQKVFDERQEKNDKEDRVDPTNVASKRRSFKASISAAVDKIRKGRTE